MSGYGLIVLLRPGQLQALHHPLPGPMDFARICSPICFGSGDSQISKNFLHVPILRQYERTPAPCASTVTRVLFIDQSDHDPSLEGESGRVRCGPGAYIIPGIPPMPPMSGMPPPPPPPFGSGLSATMASVVSNRPDTDAACCSAVRTTLAGSMTPALIRSS